MADDKTNGNGNGAIAALEFKNSVKKEEYSQNAGLFNYLIPAYGYNGREYVALPQYLPASSGGYLYHSLRDMTLLSTIEHEGVWSNAVNIATQKAASWGWEVTSEIALRQKRAQELIQDFEWLGIADYTTAISASIKGYLLTGRAFIEIERATSSRFSKVVALHHLDPMACMLTGDPRQPVNYMDTKGSIHELKDYEVGVFVMNPSPIERPYFYNSRPYQSATEAVYDQITQMEAIWRYLYEKTTGKRALSIDFITGMSSRQLQDMVVSADADMERKGTTLYKGSILVPIAQADAGISHVRIDLAGLPDGFDFQKIYDNTIITYASALGLDVNDLDPRLAQKQSLGSGTQANLLDSKTQTKGLVIWRQQFTRFMQRLVLDDATSFSWRETSTDELTKEAEMKGKIIANVSAMIKDQIITNQQGLNLLVDEEVLPREFLDVDLTQGNSIGDDEKDIAQPKDPNGQEMETSEIVPPPATANGQTLPTPATSGQASKPSSLQQQAFNGAQISSALQIITAYNEGVIERDNAVYMLGTFFQLDTETANNLVPERKGTVPDGENGTGGEIIPQAAKIAKPHQLPSGNDSSQPIAKKEASEDDSDTTTKAATSQSLARSLVASRIDEAKRLAETVIKPSEEEDETAVTTKHLAGRHNQKNHGNRQGKPAVGSDNDTSVRNPSFEPAPSEVSDKSRFYDDALNRYLPIGKDFNMIDFVNTAYSYKDDKSGIYTTITLVDIEDGLVIEGEINNKEGRNIGYFRRTISSDGVIEHTSMKLAIKFQGTGFGGRFYKNQEDTYLRAGFSNVKLEANGTVGGYAWARMGFDFDKPEIAQQFAENFSAHYKNQYGTNPPITPSHAWEIAAYKGPDGGSIGKEFLLGSNWNGVKNLSQNSAGYQIGQDYYASK